MLDLKNRVAMVTGGSRGIGKAIALALAETGAAVAVNYRARADEAEAVAEAIRQSGGRAAAFGADVSLRSAVQGMVRDVEQRLGPIDILVNNAGMAAARGLDDITEEDFDHAVAVNLKSAFLCTQAVLPGMRARRFGRIVNMSSIGARVGSGGVSIAYAASKAGLEGLTRGYAVRLAPEGVTVNAVAPGLGRHRDGQAADRGGRCGPHSGRAGRNRRRYRAGGDAACRQRLHDRPDHRGQRRHAVLLEHDPEMPVPDLIRDVRRFSEKIMLHQ